MSHLALFLLGPPRIEGDGEPIRIDRRKAIALAAYLAVAGGSHPRDALAALLWPELDQTRARSALRRTLYTLKQALDEEWLEVERESIALRRRRGFWLDVDRFHDLLAACRAHGHSLEQVCPTCLPALTEAAALYRDDFMAGFTLRDSASFDDWQSFQGQSLRQELYGALERLVCGHLLQGELEPAIAHAQRWLALDPLHEPAHRQLMLLYARAGRRSAALGQYHQCVQVLDQELGAAPAEETTQLVQAIQEGRVPQPAGLRPEARSARLHNLPTQPSPFIGREEELTEIGRLLQDPACRLLALVGPGGIGKTRLAIEAARRAVESKDFPHGVYFVPLVALNSADLIAPTIASSLHFPLHGEAAPERQLLDYLREKDMLLVVDNLEQLIPSVGLLWEILGTALGVKLLTTSRARLNLRWEWLLEIKGLKFPQDSDAAGIEDYAAVRLFVHSARRVRPNFILADEEKPFVTRICRFLEGLPLGIELAAAWLRLLSCQEIAQRIEQGLSFLATSLQDVPERHRSLRAVFGPSWELLSAEERRGCRQLSVFRGGFHGEAAERVSGASLPLLLALVNKSFLWSSTGRYEMLEVVRQYAEEKLEQDPRESEETRSRHCAYYAEFLHRWEQYLRGERQKEALEAIGAEVGNVRAAWRWALAQGKARAIGLSLESLSHFYEIRSWFREGEEAFGQAAERLGKREDTFGLTEEEGDLLLGRILAHQGWFCQRLARFEEAGDMLQRGLALFRRRGARREMIFPLNGLGAIAWRQGEYTQARRLYQEALTLCRESGDPWRLAHCLESMGNLAQVQGEYVGAKRLYQESLAIFRETGNRRGMAGCLLGLGMVASMLQEHAQAKQLLQESRDLFEETGSRHGLAVCLGRLGLVAAALEEYAEAIRLHQEDLAICRELGDRWGEAICLKNLGAVLSTQGEHRRARAYFHQALETALAIEALPEALDAVLGLAQLLWQSGDPEQAVEIAAHVRQHPAAHGQVREQAERLLSKLAGELDRPAFAAGQERGQGRTLEYFTKHLESGENGPGRHIRDIH